MRRALGVCLVAVLVLAAVPAAARADTVVPRGDTVVEVAAVGEDVVLDGRSRGSVIVVGGDVTIGPHGEAGDGVTVVGGRLRIEAGGRVHGDVLQLASSAPHPSLALLAALALALLALRLLVVALVIGLAGPLARSPSAGIALEALRERPLRTLLVGALTAVGCAAAAVVAAVTVVGLVVAGAALAVLFVAAVVGVAFALASEAFPRGTLFGALAVPLLGDALLALGAVVALGGMLHLAAAGRGAALAPRPGP